MMPVTSSRKLQRLGEELFLDAALWIALPHAPAGLLAPMTGKRREPKNLPRLLALLIGEGPVSAMILKPTGPSWRAVSREERTGLGNV